METVHRFNYGLEIFIDHDKQDYYINRFLYDDVALKDFEYVDEFALLIGYDKHRLVRHSTLTDFTN